MARIRSKDTKPEMQVRKMAHAMGLRFRLHRRDLPGTPDLVFPRLRSVVFVNGCFWHGHNGCKRAFKPSTNATFWRAKIDRNRERDQNAVLALAKLGWRVFTIWECETTPTRLPDLREKLARFLLQRET